VAISIGTIFRLEDWHGHERDVRVIQHAPEQLVGCTFAGKVKEGTYTPAPSAKNPTPTASMEVDVYTCKKETTQKVAYEYTIAEAAPF
jgi:hypothetical protein